MNETPTDARILNLGTNTLTGVDASVHCVNRSDENQS